MELKAATETSVLELRCLEDGGPGPDTLSGEGWGVQTGAPSKDSLLELQAGTVQTTTEGPLCGQQWTHSCLLTSATLKLD